MWHQEAENVLKFTEPALKWGKKKERKRRRANPLLFPQTLQVLTLLHGFQLWLIISCAANRLVPDQSQLKSTEQVKDVTESLHVLNSRHISLVRVPIHGDDQFPLCTSSDSMPASSCFFKLANVLKHTRSLRWRQLHQCRISKHKGHVLQSLSMHFTDMANQSPLSHSVWRQLQNPSHQSAPSCHFHGFWVGSRAEAHLSFWL